MDPIAISWCVRHRALLSPVGWVRACQGLLVGCFANGLFQVSVKSLCLWGRVGLITRALGISIRPDPELALALAQPTADAGAPAREGAAAATGVAEAAAVRPQP